MQIASELLNSSVFPEGLEVSLPDLDKKQDMDAFVRILAIELMGINMVYSDLFIFQLLHSGCY